MVKFKKDRKKFQSKSSQQEQEESKQSDSEGKPVEAGEKKKAESGSSSSSSSSSDEEEETKKGEVTEESQSSSSSSSGTDSTETKETPPSDKQSSDKSTKSSKKGKVSLGKKIVDFAKSFSGKTKKATKKSLDKIGSESKRAAKKIKKSVKSTKKSLSSSKKTKKKPRARRSKYKEPKDKNDFKQFVGDIILPFNPELVIERWLMSSLCGEVVGSPFKMNSLSCPIASISAYTAIIFAVSPADRKQMMSSFVMNSELACKLEPVVKHCKQLRLDEAYSFFQMIVDDTETTRVNGTYLRNIQKLFGEHVLVRLKPAYCDRFLSSLSHGAILGPPSVPERTIGYCSAGVHAKWKGVVGNNIHAPFALTYFSRQKHIFFPLKTYTRHCIKHGFDIWHLQLLSFSGCLGLLIMRPLSIGSLYKNRERLSAEHLSEILYAMDDQTPVQSTVLLPAFAIKCNEDLMVQWRSDGAFKKSPKQPFPPIGSIWHMASLNIDRYGISTRNRAQENNLTTPHISRGSKEMMRKHQCYNARFDSPFLFAVVSGWVPLMAGMYSGSPPMQALQLVVPIPKRLHPSKSPLQRLREQKQNSKVKRQRSSSWDRFKRLFH